jgi:hypothetical protein
METEIDASHSTFEHKYDALIRQPALGTRVRVTLLDLLFEHDLEVNSAISVQASAATLQNSQFLRLNRESPAVNGCSFGLVHGFLMAQTRPRLRGALQSLEECFDLPLRERLALVIRPILALEDLKRAQRSEPSLLETLHAPELPPPDDERIARLLCLPDTPLSRCIREDSRVMPIQWPLSSVLDWWDIFAERTISVAAEIIREVHTLKGDGWTPLFSCVPWTAWPTVCIHDRSIDWSATQHIPSASGTRRGTSSPAEYFEDESASSTCTQPLRLERVGTRYVIWFEGRRIEGPSNSKYLRALDFLIHHPWRAWHPWVLDQLVPAHVNRRWNPSAKVNARVEAIEDAGWGGPRR